MPIYCSAAATTGIIRLMQKGRGAQHPRQPGPEHTVAKTLANWPGLNISRSGGMPLSANHSSSLLFTIAFDSVRFEMRFEIATDAGKLSANHGASDIDVLLGRNQTWQLP